MAKYVEGKIKINPFTDLLSVETNEVNEIPLEELHEFKEHPFKVLDDDKMKELVESIKKQGVMVPGIVRESADGGFEIISGHRRKRACELAGLQTMPVIIKKLNDDDAAIIMVDTNLRQREEILPSEKAFAYKMKLDAVKRRAGRPAQNNSCQVGTNLDEKNSRQVVGNFEGPDGDNSRQLVGNLESAEIIGNSLGESGRQVQRFIRLTELNTKLLDMVDRKKLKFNPAVELSYLTSKQQDILIKVMDEEGKVPSLSQAQRIKRLSQDGNFNKSEIRLILVGSFIRNRQVTIDESIIMRYFTPDTSNEDIEKLICTLLEGWRAGGGSL